MLLVTLPTALAIASIHIFSRLLGWLDGIPRARLLSAAGGISVSFVVVRLLPGLGEHVRVLGETVETDIGAVPYPVYLLTLLGILVFFGIERLVIRSRAEAAGDKPSAGAFWLQMSAYAGLNFTVGYLLVEMFARGVRAMIVFAIAMGLKFIINDRSLHREHRQRYDGIGRLILAAAVVSGWAIAIGHPLPPGLLAVLQAFLAGAVLLNVFKEELPGEQQSRFWPFALGAIGYTVLLLLI